MKGNITDTLKFKMQQSSQWGNEFKVREQQK